MTKADDHYVQVAETLIEKLEQGTAPWQKPWDSGGYGSLPMNPTTGNRYRGGNALQLMMREYGDPRWMTYRQAQQAEGTGSQGERGPPEFIGKLRRSDSVRGEDGKPVMIRMEIRSRKRCSLSVRVALSAMCLTQSRSTVAPLVADKARVWADVQRAENILEASGVKLVHRAPGTRFLQAGGRCYLSP